MSDYYRPVILVDYTREAYIYDLNQIRITFDSNIKKSEVNLSNMFDKNIEMQSVINAKKIIMEVKFNNTLPYWIKNTLQLPRFEHCAISKYTLSRYLKG